MSIKAIPLLIFSLILYNAIVFFLGTEGVPPHEVFYGVAELDAAKTSATIAGATLFSVGMPLGGLWVFKLGDLVMTITLVLLCLEVIKATYTRGSGLADQALSMILFIVFLVEFLLVPQAGTSLFFMMTLASGIDVIAGAIIGIRTARRDFGFGSDVT